MKHVTLGIVLAAVGVPSVVACAALPTFTSAVALRDPAPESGVHIGGTDPVSVGSGAAGYTVIGGAWHAARWSADGSGIPLGDLPGQSTVLSYAHGINALGQTAGHASLVGVSGSRAVRWSADGSATLLSDLPGVTTNNSYAFGINEAGQAAGFAFTGAVTRAVRWESDGSATRLDDAPNQSNLGNAAFDVNDAGQVAGRAHIISLGGQRAARWSADGSVTVLGDVQGLTTANSHAVAINNAGEAAGYMDKSLFGSDLHAVRWAADGSAMLLRNPLGSTNSVADDMTNAGLVAGKAYLSDIRDSRAVIWDASGDPSLLQDLMDDGNTWAFTSAIGIDADGTTLRVLAQGSRNGGPSSWYLLDAIIPEPSATGLAACLALLLSHRRLPVSSTWRRRVRTARHHGFAHVRRPDRAGRRGHAYLPG